MFESGFNQIRVLVALLVGPKYKNQNMLYSKFMTTTCQIEPHFTNNPTCMLPVWHTYGLFSRNSMRVSGACALAYDLLPKSVTSHTSAHVVLA